MTNRALGRPPLTAGANKGRTINIERMMRDYWEAFGWDAETGEPTPEGLNQLGLKI
jgi:aldehyde:ferredoxin oxidoreductase